MISRPMMKPRVTTVETNSRAAIWPIFLIR
jgi:hypothetical protein